MSHIVVLSGSPRKDGNTALLVQAFVQGAENANTVEVISVADHRVHPCTGCNACMRAEGHACAQEDDMSAIFEKLEKADVLVVASPVYLYGISAQLKAVIDRLHTPRRNTLPIKKLALILVGGAELPELFDSIIVQAQLLRNFFHLEDAGMVLVRGAREKGAVREGSGLNEAYILGRSIK